MYTKFRSRVLVTFSTILGISQANAAQPVNLRDAEFQQAQQEFHIALPHEKVGADAVSADVLRLIQQYKDERNVTHFRMQQQYAGFDVIGGYAIVHSQARAQGLLAAGNHPTMNGIVYRGLEAELGKPDVAFVKNANTALQAFAAPYKGYNLSQQSVKPIVYIDAQHKAHWAYKVSLFVDYDDKTPEKPTAFIDANTFKPFVQWNGIHTVFAPVKGEDVFLADKEIVNPSSQKNSINTASLTPVKGKGYGGNPKIGEHNFGLGEYPYLEIRRDAEKSLCYMENAGVKVVDMKHITSSTLSTPMEFACREESPSTEIGFWTGYNADGYDRQNEGFSASNDALYAGYVINHLYKDWYGVDTFSNNDGTPAQLVLRVHYNKNWENANWDGLDINFGDGANHYYPLVSVGIVAHEASLGFTAQHAGLYWFEQAGGINIAFSDMAAQAAEFYATGKNSWKLGAEVVKQSSGIEALRYMDLPSRDGKSIDSADQYRDDMSVYYSSGVFNRLFYLLATSPRWNTKKAFDVMVKANIGYWTPNSTFKEAACGVIEAAKDLNYAVTDVKNALDLVKIDYKSCRI